MRGSITFRRWLSLLGLMACGIVTCLRANETSDVEVDFLDFGLRAAVEEAVGVQPGFAIRRSHMAGLRTLEVSAHAYNVRDLTGLEYAVNLERLDVRDNQIVDIGALAELQSLRRVDLDGNRITDIAPLAANAGLGPGDQVYLANNRLNDASANELIPSLEARGVFVAYHDDHGDSRVSATALPLGGKVAGSIDQRRDADHFYFEVASEAEVAVFTTGLDTQGVLHGPTTRRLASDNGSGSLGNFLIRQRLQPGRHDVRVTGVRGPYVIHAVEGVPVRFRATGLRDAVAEALGNLARDGITATEMAMLTGTLDVSQRRIVNLSGLEHAVNVTELKLAGNSIRDATTLASLTSLAVLDLERNFLRDVGPLVANTGIDAGDRVFLGINRLSAESIGTAIPALEDRGVFVGVTDQFGRELEVDGALPFGGTASGSLYPLNDRDSFELHIDESASVMVFTTGELDTAGRLYNAEGKLLAVNDNVGRRSNFMITQALDAGDYRVEVRGANPLVRGPYGIEAREDVNATVLPDANLRAVVADALNKTLTGAITAVDMAVLRSLDAAGLGIVDLTGLERADNLTHLNLDDNAIVDIGPLAGLTELTELRLTGNAVRDVAPLLENTGLGDGDRVFLQDNPLSATSRSTHIPEMMAREIAVTFEADHTERGLDATVLGLGRSVAGSIYRENDRDQFRLPLATARAVAIFTTGDVDVIGTLSDSGSVQLAQDGDRGPTGNFLLRASVEAGDYYVDIKGKAGSTGRYVVHAIVDEPVEIPDGELRSRLENVFRVNPPATVATGDLETLEVFDASGARIESLAGLGAAVNLRRLILRNNLIEDLGPLSSMTKLAEVDLHGNEVTDIAALIGNPGLGSGDKVVLSRNPLDADAVENQLPVLEERGVFVGYLDDHGGSLSDATALLPGGAVAGTLFNAFDEDSFRLEITAATDLAIYTTGPTDTEGSLYTKDSARLAADLNSGPDGNFIIRRHLLPGVYRISVNGVGRGFSRPTGRNAPRLPGVGPYALHAAIPPAAAPTNITALRDGSHLVVTWDALPTDAAVAITRYRVTAAPADGSTPLGCTVGPEEGSGCTIVGLADGVDYAVTVQAVNAVGFGPVGTFETLEPIIADVSLTRFWRGWRLALAGPVAESEE